MINGQNPTLPTPTDPVEIDQAIQDLQLRLSTNLVWLTHGYGRAYIHVDETKSKKYTYPAIYLGKQNTAYNFFLASPDNDKTGQSFFLVDTERVQNFALGQYNMLQYSMSIVFTVNLKLANELLSETENFQANLIQQVRQVLTRDLQPSFYTLELDEIKLNFKDVFREFVLNDDKVLEKAPFTHFRVNCTLLFQEQCNVPIVDRCQALQNNISQDEKLECILPTYDFSDTTVQDATTPTQQTDLTNWLCPPVNPYSYLLDGINEGFSLTSSTLNALNGFQPYTITSWVRSTNYNLLQYIFSKAVSGSAGYGFYLGSGVVQAGVGGTIGDSAVKRGIIPLTSNTWYHLAVTYNGSGDANGFNFYVDGVLLTNTAIVSNSFSTSTLTSSPVRIGSNNAVSSFFSGNICYTRQWGREFTLSDIVSDYHSRVLLPNAIYPLDLIFGFTPSDLDIFANDRWNTTNAAEPNNGFGSSNLEFSKRSASIPF
jgi:hypothetical protein